MSARLEINLAAKPKPRPTAAPVVYDATKFEPAEFPLKAGRVYRTFDGRIVGPLKEYGSIHWMRIHKGGDNYEYWRVGNGKHHVNPHEKAIVQEYVGNAALDDGIITVDQIEEFWKQGRTLQYKMTDESQTWWTFPRIGDVGNKNFISQYKNLGWQWKVVA